MEDWKMEKNEFWVNGFKITILNKPAFKAIGLSKFMYCSDGHSIGDFLNEIKNNGQLNKLEKTINYPQQVWVSLSDNEGTPNSDCRCTVCIFETEKHDFSQFEKNELFSFDIPASEWADYEVNEKQSPTELHQGDVYKMIGETGYKFNQKVGLHFDNEHEWEPGKKMHFLLPVTK
jgi:predicted transcriptional regulator YdeE